MKLELAILPMDVWADVFVYPWISREQLALIVDQFKERAFAEKLQTFLHDPKCGKHSLRFLKIHYKPKENIKPKIKSQRRATLAVASRNRFDSIYKDCDFPEVGMPENIKTFKQLTIGHFDDQVLEFLNKIKLLFTNVLLDIESTQSAKNLRILFTHLIPMLGGIRGIQCKHGCLEFFNQHLPGTLAAAKELSLSDDETATKAYIPAYLDWLNAPQDFDREGPRFLDMSVQPNTIGAMVDAVRKQFSAATTPSEFVIFLGLHVEWRQRNYRADEFSIQNTTTKEQLAVRNASFTTRFGIRVRYVEIQRNPIGAEANMREWIKNRKKYKSIQYHDEAEPEQMISIDGYSLTVGQINKKTAGAVNQDNDQPANDDKDEAGPSSSAKSAKEETCACVIA